MSTVLPLGFYQTVNLINAVFAFLIGCFILQKKKLIKQEILFLVFTFSVSFWAFFYFLAFQVSNQALAIFFFRTCMIGAALILPSFTEFVFSLLKKEIKPTYRLLNWGITILIILSIYTNFYASNAGPFLVFPFWPIAGPVCVLQIILFAINIFFSQQELFRASLSSPKQTKQQAKIIFIGTSLGFLGGATNFLLWFRIPFPPILNILIPIYVLSVAYAVTKHHLMNIEVIIKKTAIYSILTAIITGVLISLIVASEMIFRGFLGYNSIWLAILAAFIISLIFQPLRNRIQDFIDKLFFKGSYDYRETLKKLSQTSVSIIELDKLISLFKNQVKNIFKTKKVSLYLYDNDKKGYLNKTQ